MTTLDDLLSNNREWAARIRREDPGFFKRLSKQQSPKYLWIGCSDSRVPANQILGLDPGDRDRQFPDLHERWRWSRLLFDAFRPARLRTRAVCRGLVNAVQNRRADHDPRGRRQGRRDGNGQQPVGKVELHQAWNSTLVDPLTIPASRATSQLVNLTQP